MRPVSIIVWLLNIDAGYIVPSRPYFASYPIYSTCTPSSWTLHCTCVYIIIILPGTSVVECSVQALRISTILATSHHRLHIVSSCIYNQNSMRLFPYATDNMLKDTLSQSFYNIIGYLNTPPAPCQTPSSSP